MSRGNVRFVLDSSVALSWAFGDEHDPMAMRAQQLLETETGQALVPPIWWYEVRNILVSGERRGRVTPAATAIFLKQIAELSIETTSNPEERILLDLARQEKLTVYDASYLTLALQENIALATLDRALRSAALSQSVALLV